MVPMMFGWGKTALLLGWSVIATPLGWGVMLFCVFMLKWCAVVIRICVVLGHDVIGFVQRTRLTILTIPFA